MTLSCLNLNSRGKLFKSVNFQLNKGLIKFPDDLSRYSSLIRCLETVSVFLLLLHWRIELPIHLHLHPFPSNSLIFVATLCTNILSFQFNLYLILIHSKHERFFFVQGMMLSYFLNHCLPRSSFNWISQTKTLTILSKLYWWPKFIATDRDLSF